MYICMYNNGGPSAMNQKFEADVVRGDSVIQTMEDTRTPKA